MKAIADITLERQFVSAVVANSNELDRCPLTPSDLANAECATLLRIVIELRGRGESSDLVAVMREAQRTNAPLSDEALVWSVDPVPAMSVHRRLKELATARRLRAAFTSCLRELDAMRIECAEQIALDALENLKRAEQANIESSVTTVSRIVSDVMIGKKPGLVPTGIGKVDAMIGGIEAGTITFIGGDTGTGKSSLMLYMADRMNALGYRPGIVSCEDSRQVFGTRILSTLSGIPGLALRRGEITRERHEEPLTRAVEAVHRRPTPIAYEIGSNDAQVVAAMTALVKDHGCRVLFVDYIQTINCSEGGENRREDMRRIASRIKGAAARLGVPVIVGSQISVGDIHAEKLKPPGKHALKESRDLTNMAEWVIVIWRESEAMNANVLGKLAKSKCGGDGTEFTFERNAAGGLNEIDKRLEGSNRYDDN